ncbi:hypothetical protein MSAN_02327200 [Mycena sanguinolenta]|uniref:Uncharacterized protein n=1 Tax=Mycena sanguinolenta TaxID=230812 RepID=A0A8H6X888_9AGAR|nr:hypothetical protein MSAN_02327200 [Mycena sanguinolenta]
MVESQVSNVFVHQVRQALKAEARKIKSQPKGYLVTFPRSFAMGTDIRSYDTISVDRGDYTDDLEPADPQHTLSQFDWDRVTKNAPWKYIVDKPLASGEVYIQVRGKCIAISCGYHVLVCHMSLEGNIRPMSRSDFDALVAVCTPGSNKDRIRASQMRSFVVPEQFIDPNSRGTGKTVNILAAIVTDNTAIVLMDFSRMSRVHIVSMSRKFVEADLTPGSSVWDRLWQKFPGGPDWNIERPAAIAHLAAWRERMLSTGSTTAIVEELTSVHGPGGGMGKQLANDFLFEIAVHPDMPSGELCTDEAQYERFRTHIPVFMSRWVSGKFLTLCGGTPNSKNPLAFNWKSNKNFLRMYVLVYRRRETRVKAELYNLYQSLGLLDPNHTIGTPFTSETQAVTTQFKEVKVWRYLNNRVNRYHIIRATIPSHWIPIFKTSQMLGILPH